MVEVSVVIITKNEEDILIDCIQKASLITDDIVVIYNGHAGGTVDIAAKYGCRLYKKAWDGYGANKNKGVEEAKYHWILSIDADEVPDYQLIKEMHEVDLCDASVVYDIKFRSYLGKKLIRFGNWGRDHHIRLFNRNLVRWSESVVHESLILSTNVRVERLNGYLEHYSAWDIEHYDSKCAYYAKLSAKKYFRAGKKANAFKLYVSPAFAFFKNYVMYLGFLDGAEGFEIARTMLKSTWRKYHYLSQMENFPTKKEPVEDNLVVKY